MEQVSIAEARQNLPALVHEVERTGSLQLTRRGVAVAVLLSQDEYDRLAGNRTDLWEAILRFRAARDPEVDFDDADFEGLRDPSPGRDFHWPE